MKPPEAAIPSSGTDPLDELGSDADAPLTVGEIVADRYRIAELLGKGGMGSVYRADHVHIRKSFAIKVLHRELTHNPEAVRRFEREAIAAARIDHPNVATATDFGRLESGAFYLVLDYVQGCSLRELLNVERRLPEARVLRIARQIASALAAAHCAGIVHRDLKPDNVMLVEANGETDFVKVLDFGIAKLRTEDIAEEPAITRFGTVFGTPEYMSPEQALGQSVDARCDLYTLGIMLYEMLVGKTPFADEQLVIILTRQMTELPSPLPETVSAEVRQLVMQLLEKQPDSRPATAELVLGVLDELLQYRASSSSQVIIPTSLERRSADGSTMATSETLFDNDEQRLEQSTANVRRDARALAGIKGVMQPGFVRNPSLPPWLRRHVSVVGRPVPLVLLAMGATLLVALVIGALGLWAIFFHHGGDASDHRETAGLSELLGDSAETKRVKAWMEQAAAGDPVALQHLEELPTSERSSGVWLAIAAGKAQTKQWTSVVTAYQQALDIEPQLALSKRALADLFQAATDGQASAEALELASKRLGGTGADLIYAALDAAAAGKAPKLDRRRAKTLLESKANAHATPALRVALKLDAARNCVEYKNLLTEVAATGDQRSSRILRKLAHDRGCGLLGLQDCYSCLRGGRALAQAVEASKARPSPTFLEPQTEPGTQSGSGPR